MKNLFTLSALCFVVFAQAQDNTLPTTGNVGIGTTQPDCRLTVNGNVRIDSTLHIKDSLLIEKTATIAEDVKIEGQLILANTQQDTTLNGNEILVRSGNGQVKKLGVDQISNFLYSKFCTTDINYNVTNPIWSNGLNKIFTDCPKVFVGIGTSQPSSNLHIKVSPLISSGAPILLIENSQRRLFQINNDGIVRTREVVVNLENSWPDYVFDQQYSLMPLSEVENYIHKNGHLPNVPSAQKVEETGIELGEMNRILLEKIEELTLHLIEQQNRIEELEKTQALK